MSDIFMLGDCVNYTGDRIRSINPKERCWIHATVGGEEGTFVVEFSERKQRDSYIINAKDLMHYRQPKSDKPTGPVVQPRYSKLDNDADLE